MTSHRDDRSGSAGPAVYEIRIAGELDPTWAAWFDGLAVTRVDGDSLLTGPVRDQAALHGVLRRLRDLGLPLVSITPLERGQQEDREQ
jgi:hypothetical protein